MYNKIFLLSSFISIFIYVGLFAQRESGEFAVLNEPGPLFSLGQNILKKNQLEQGIGSQYLVGQREIRELSIGYGILYGLTNKTSLLMIIPFLPINKIGDMSSAGIDDILIQGETVVYKHETKTAHHQATVIFTATFPTGSPTKEPPTGTGSFNFLLGGTAHHMSRAGYFFASGGILIVTRRKTHEFGDTFFYEFGYGNVLRDWSDGYLGYIIECNGIYAQKDTRFGVIDLDSGGNIIFFGPSIRLSYRELLVQTGIQFPVAQNLFGNQGKVRFRYGYTIAFGIHF